MIVLHRHGIDIAYAVAYFICGGSKAMNRKLAYERKVCLRTLRIPWLLAADFNMTPDEARECGLADIMGGLIVEPKGVELNAPQGKGGC